MYRRMPRRRLPLILVLLALCCSPASLLGIAGATALATPVANPQTITTSFNLPITIALTGFEPENPTATFLYAIATNPTKGSLSGFNTATGLVTYTPAVGYSGPDSFTFTINNGVEVSAPATIALTISPQPTLTLSPGALGFGSVQVGTASGTQTTTLTNTSGVFLSLTSIAISGDFAQSNNCLSTIAPGASCFFSINFLPTALGLRTGTLTIVDNAVGTPHLVTLGGNGVGPVTLRLATTGAGSIAASSGTVVTPSTLRYEGTTVVTLTAIPGPGYRFIGWTFNGTFAGWANPVTLTTNGNHTILAAFALTPGFNDLDASQSFGLAVQELATRGTIRGYGDGRFGPYDQTLRAQNAALIARAMGWENEEHGALFADRGPVDDALWRNVNTVAFYNVARGFPDGTYQPVGPVLASQTIAFITRAMITKGYWALQPDNPALYPNVPDSSGHRQDIATFVFYAGAIPDSPATAAPLGGWDQAITRGWFARALWQALNSYWSADRVP